MKARCFLAFCLTLFSVSASCQSLPGESDVPSAEQARAEVFGGFALEGGRAPANGGRSATGSAWGFNGGADFRMFPHIFLVADVIGFPLTSSGSSSNSSSDTFFLFGPRYLVHTRSQPRVAVFGQFLAGGDTYHNTGQPYTWAFNNATNLAFTADGGVDLSVAKRLGLRFEAGYLRTKLTVSTYSGPANPPYVTENLGLFAVNVVYRF